VTDKEVEESVAMMIHTSNIEKEDRERRGSKSSYLEMFRGTNLRRTEIAVIVYCCTNVLNPFGSNWSVVFLEQAGMSTSDSFDFSIGGSAISVFAVFVLWFLMQRKVSRRRIFLFGLISSLIVAIIIGVLGFVDRTKPVLYSMAVILVIESFCSFLGVQATVYPIVSEMPANSLRSRTVGLSRALCNIVALINGIITPRMLNSGPGNWDLGPKSDIYAAVWLLIASIWAYFRLPDCTKLTYAEIDILFENKVPARKFATTEVDISAACLAEDQVVERV
jgi:SP family general alpha glucoside:H+ symporter-like MFS transporter